MTGWFYYGYMAFLSIFCTNTINILAGVNGIEAGQSVVIALCIVINDILYVMKPGHPATDAHLFSLYFLLPFIGVSLALLYHNWYNLVVCCSLEVSEQSICWRYVHLLCRYDICGGRNIRPLFQNGLVILYPADIQFCIFCTPNIWHCPVSTTSTPKVFHSTMSLTID